MNKHGDRWFAKLSSLVESGEYLKAIEFGQKILKNEPNNITANFQLA